MRIPTPERAEAYLREAEVLNPGPWVEHSLNVARAARAIAAHCPDLDPEAAYVLGCLHDIGRREGVTGMRHTIDGYHFLTERGYEDAARICLTHSFAYKDVRAIYGKWDCSKKETAFIERYLAQVDYTSYDRLIQLCDALAMASGFVLMEKRMLDVTLRYGPNEYTVRKWQAAFQIKESCEALIGQSVYRLLPGVVENTFGIPISELS